MQKRFKYQVLNRPLIVMKRDPSVKFLCVIGVILSFTYLNNAFSSFEDLWLLDHFSSVLVQHGYFKTMWVLFSGMDMPTEYRTYGLSRLLHFFLWSIVGQQSSLFPLIIALSQLGSTIAFLYLLRARSIDEQVSLAVAIIWLISPLLVTYGFHRYSYLILPFQLVIVSCLVLDRISTSSYRNVIASLLGFACALTGEMFLIAGPLVFLVSGVGSHDKSKLRLSFVTIAAMMVTLIMHRWIWSTFFHKASSVQRFYWGANIDEIILRTELSFDSITKSAWMQLQQLVEITISGPSWCILIGGLAGFVYVWITSRLSPVKVLQTSPTVLPSTTKKKHFFNINLTLVLFGVALLSLLIYLLTSIFSGQIYGTMPRRYGHVSLTLLYLAFVIGIAVLSDVMFGAKRIVLALFIGLTATLASCLMGGLFQIQEPLTHCWFRK